MDKQIANLCEFLDASCSVYHAHAQLVKMLNDAGYTRLCEADSWNLAAGGKYYCSDPRQIPDMIETIVGEVYGE